MREIEFADESLAIISQLRMISSFSVLSDQELGEILPLSTLREYDPGEPIVQEGDYDSWVYFLITGKLEVSKDGKPLSYLQRSGDMFGEMGVIDASPRSATIKAAGKSLILGLDGAIIDRKLKNNDAAFCYLIYRLFAEVLAVRLRETTEENIRLRKALAKLGAG